MNHLNCDFLVSKFAFKFNLMCRYSRVVIAMGLIAVTVGRAAGARREARERERETSGRLNLSKFGGGASAGSNGGGGSGPWVYD